MASRKPLIVLDWRRPDGSSYVPSESRSLPQRLQGKGFVLGILSFASKQSTQEKVLAGAQELERQLPNPCVFVAVTNRKFEEDRAPRHPSITGHSDSKARLLLNLCAAAFIDDQVPFLKEARHLQKDKPSQLRLATVQAKPWKRGEVLEDLGSWAEDHSASNLPSIETLRQYLWIFEPCSGLLLVRAGRDLDCLGKRKAFCLLFGTFVFLRIFCCCFKAVVLRERCGLDIWPLA